MNKIIKHKFDIDGKLKDVHFAIENEAWINATEVAKLYGKQILNYWNHSGTIEYMESLERFNSLGANELKRAVQGKYGGTYIHPDLVIHFARWADSDFAVQCDMFLKQIVLGKIEKSKVRKRRVIVNNALIGMDSCPITLKKYLDNTNLLITEACARGKLEDHQRVKKVYTVDVKYKLSDSSMGTQSGYGTIKYYPEELDKFFSSIFPTLF